MPHLLLLEILIRQPAPLRLAVLIQTCAVVCAAGTLACVASKVMAFVEWQIDTGALVSHLSAALQPVLGSISSCEFAAYRIPAVAIPRARTAGLLGHEVLPT